MKWSILLLVGACGGTAIPGDVEHRLLIDKVVAEPTSPCAGDDVRISVSTRSTDPSLVIMVEGERGPRVLRTYDRAGSYDVSAVVTIPGIAIDSRSLRLEVRDCGARPSLEITQRFVPGQPDSVVFAVSGTTGLTPPLRLRWDFGDGTSRESDGAVVKSYALRPQATPSTSYEIMLTALDAEGRQAVRRVSLTLVNHEAAAGANGARRLPIEAEPFAKAGPGGKRALLRVKNILDEQVTFERLEVVALRCDGSPPDDTTVALKDGFASPPSALIPGQIWSGWLTLPETMAPAAACRAKVRLLGATASGAPLSAETLLELAPPAGVVVDDPATLEDVRRAQQILRRREVTQAEVERLRSN